MRKVTNPVPRGPMQHHQIIRAWLCALLLLVGLAPAAHGGDYVSVEAPSSFRGMAWGTPLSELPDLRPVQEPGFEGTYFRPGEKRTFGRADIQSVAYYFRKERLYRVGVAFAGRANHFLIKEQLLTMYGPGRGVGSRYGWMWPDFSVELTYDDDAGSGAVYYTFEGALD